MSLGDFFSSSGPAWVGLATLVLDLVIRIVALGVVPHNRRPSAAWGWLLAIFFIPIIGVLLYLLIGRSTLPPGRSRKQAGVAGLVPDDAGGRYATGDLASVADWALGIARLNFESRGLPLLPGNAIDIINDDAGCIERMAGAVRGARRSVDVEFYIAAYDKTTDTLVDALLEAHDRGVRVRVLTDFLGSLSFPGHQQLTQRLEQHGVPWRRSLPVRPLRGQYQRPDLRNHRKIVVVDGEIAFTGSQNMIDASYNKKKNRQEHLQWRDLMLHVRGPIVAQLQAVFLADWCSESDEPLPSTTDAAPLPARQAADPGLLCQVLPSGPGGNDESNLRLFNSLFFAAHERIVIATPYLVPEQSMLLALSTAAQRGVAVHLFLSEQSDHTITHHAQRSFYQMLMRAGVTIHLYKKPIILHAKFVLIDDDVAVVASSNMDIRSFVLNLEVNVLVCDRGFVARMNTVVAGYEAESSVLELEQWMARPWYEKYLDNVCRLTSGLQ